MPETGTLEIVENYRFFGQTYVKKKPKTCEYRFSYDRNLNMIIFYHLEPPYFEENQQ